MTDNADRSRRRRFLHLIGTAAAAGLAGCNAGDDSDTDPATDSPPTETPLGTGTTTDGQIPPDTETSTTSDPQTETETSTEEETPPETSTPTPDLSFDEIYQQQMFHEQGKQGVDRNWDWIEEQLREDGHDLSNTENMTGNELSRLMEDVAGHAGSYAGIYGAAAAAYTAFEKLDIGTDQVIVDAREANVGQNIPTAVIRIDDNDGDLEWLDDNYRPGGSRQTPDNDGGDSAWYLRHNEEEVAGAEQTLQDIYDPDDVESFSPMDIENLKNRIEAYGGREEISDEEYANAWDLWMRQISDVIVGYHSDELNFVVTEDAHRLITEKERSGNVDHIRELTMQYYEREVPDGQDLLVDASNGEFTYGTTDWNPTNGWAKPAN
jgi:hypothetical protein